MERNEDNSYSSFLDIRKKISAAYEDKQNGNSTRLLISKLKVLLLTVWHIKKVIPIVTVC